MSLILALGRQKQVDCWVWGQPGLESEFQDSKGYKEKPCLKQQQQHVLIMIILKEDLAGLRGSILSIDGLSWEDPPSVWDIIPWTGILDCIKRARHKHWLLSAFLTVPALVMVSYHSIGTVTKTGGRGHRHTIAWVDIRKETCGNWSPCGFWDPT